MCFWEVDFVWWCCLNENMLLLLQRCLSWAIIISWWLLTKAITVKSDVSSQTKKGRKGERSNPRYLGRQSNPVVAGSSNT